MGASGARAGAAQCCQPGGMKRENDVVVGPIVAVANESFRKELGVLPDERLDLLGEKLRLVMGR